MCPLTAAAVGCALNVVRVSGGGALAAAMQTPTQIDSEPATFGIAAGGASTALSSVQAGAHPDLSVSLAFNTVSRDGFTAGSFKNTTYDLPAGFAGDLLDTPACQAAVFLKGSCPIATQVGVTTVIFASEAGLGAANFEEPVYNLAPDPGYVSKLGFSVGTNNHYEGDVGVRAPGQAGEYGLQTTFYDSTAGILDIDNVSLTVWGVPADRGARRAACQAGRAGLWSFWCLLRSRRSAVPDEPDGVWRRTVASGIQSHVVAATGRKPASDRDKNALRADRGLRRARDGPVAHGRSDLRRGVLADRLRSRYEHPADLPQPDPGDADVAAGGRHAARRDDRQPVLRRGPVRVQRGAVRRRSRAGQNRGRKGTGPRLSECLQARDGQDQDPVDLRRSHGLRLPRRTGAARGSGQEPVQHPARPVSRRARRRTVVCSSRLRGRSN